jgi:subtilisin family serine protease
LPAAVDWAVDHGAKVICLAVGGGDQDAWSPALARAIASDVVIVAGTGNRPITSSIGLPAGYPGVVAVTATDRTGRLASFAVTGPPTVLSAPGVDIPRAGLASYELGNGTSDSTALVAGVAALIRAKYPNLSAKEVIHRMTATADDKGAPGRDDTYGYGIVNPVKALTADVPPLPADTTPASTPTATGDPSSGISRNTLILGGVVILLLLAAGGVVGLVAVLRSR